eukprot:m.554652 g.554652  ORF g.554652 m.554652 type:complete len:448 (-) comp22178_c0_seq6:688-2031(-)
MPIKISGPHGSAAVVAFCGFALGANNVALELLMPIYAKTIFMIDASQWGLTYGFRQFVQSFALLFVPTLMSTIGKGDAARLGVLSFLATGSFCWFMTWLSADGWLFQFAFCIAGIANAISYVCMNVCVQNSAGSNSDAAWGNSAYRIVLLVSKTATLLVATAWMGETPQAHAFHLITGLTCAGTVVGALGLHTLVRSPSRDKHHTTPSEGSSLLQPYLDVMEVPGFIGMWASLAFVPLGNAVSRQFWPFLLTDLGGSIEEVGSSGALASVLGLGSILLMGAAVSRFSPLACSMSVYLAGAVCSVAIASISALVSTQGTMVAGDAVKFTTLWYILSTSLSDAVPVTSNVLVSGVIEHGLRGSPEKTQTAKATAFTCMKISGGWVSATGLFLSGRVLTHVKEVRILYYLCAVLYVTASTGLLVVSRTSLKNVFSKDMTVRVDDTIKKSQ